MFRRTHRTFTTRAPSFDPFDDITPQRSDPPPIDLVKVLDLATLARESAGQLKVLCDYFQVPECGVSDIALQHAEEAEHIIRGYRIMAHDHQLRLYYPRHSDPTEEYLVARMAWSTHRVLREIDRIVWGSGESPRWKAAAAEWVHDKNNQVTPLIRVPVPV